MIRHYILAKTPFDVHSPFAYALIEAVFERKKRYYAFEEIEALREKLLANDKAIDDIDLGAPSTTADKKRVATWTAATSTTPSEGQILFRLAQKLQTESILEIGTSVGFATMYLAKSVPEARIITIEGHPQVAGMAERNFNALNIENVRIIKGRFDAALPRIIEQGSTFDLVFVDGNHTFEATVGYWKLLKPALRTRGIVVFDDIYWNSGMERAWNEIKADQETCMTLDFYSFGIAVITPISPGKQHFRLVPSQWKPWRMIQL